MPVICVPIWLQVSLPQVRPQVIHDEGQQGRYHEAQLPTQKGQDQMKHQEEDRQD